MDGLVFVNCKTFAIEGDIIALLLAKQSSQGKLSWLRPAVFQGRQFIDREGSHASLEKLNDRGTNQDTHFLECLFKKW